jgi:hypothetical protein
MLAAHGIATFLPDASEELSAILLANRATPTPRLLSTGDWTSLATWSFGTLRHGLAPSRRLRAAFAWDRIRGNTLRATRSLQPKAAKRGAALQIRRLIPYLGYITAVTIWRQWGHGNSLMTL